MRSIRPKCPKCGSAKFSLDNIPLGGIGESAAVIYCSKCGAIVSHSDKYLKIKPVPSKGGGVGFAPVHGV
jgi:predicted nucleic-acid-binding Zn-ribbon protein